MLLHPLFSYPAILLALAVFVLYFLGVLKLRGLIKPALYLNIGLIGLLVLSVIFGFTISNVPLVQSKAPFIWAFPHKWNGLLLLLVSLVNFLVFWFKGDSIGKKAIVLPALGILSTLFQLFTGWMLRLVFFS
ncbi:MAG: hypothetical protein ACK4LA_01505 [Aquificaceae bacterium]